MSLYESSEMAIISSFDEFIKKGIYIPSNVDLENTKAVRLYRDYIGTVNSIKPKEYLSKDFDVVDRKDVINISYEAIRRIFGKDLLDEFREFMSTVRLNDGKTILDGVSLRLVNRYNENDIIRVTEVSSIDLSCSAFSIVHEFIHYYISKYNISIERKKYYEEILSIYGEIIAAKLCEEYFGNSIEKKCDETRLEGVNWHYFVHPAEIDEVRKQLRLHPEFKEVVFQSVPWLKNNSEFLKEENYRKQLADSYGMGYLYARYLSLLASGDSDKVNGKVSDVLSGELGLQDMLNYFGINTKNRTMYDEVNKHIRTLK